MTSLPPARQLTDDEWKVVEPARTTIDATTDAGPDEDGVPRWAAPSAPPTVGSSPG